MNRYLVIALAIIVGGVIGLWLSRRQKDGETTLVEEGRQPSLWPWIAGLVVLMAGLMMLVSHERADKDARYAPAQINNGDITPGQFGKNEHDG
ncbi:MAG: hypothetical protein ACON4P_02995 [Candidatus Puniceispirillales bacterium]